MGNHGAIAAGDVQWMTAGSGIIHQEMPKGDPAGRMHGFQLWANLPASLKMTAPRYQEVKALEIPEITEDDGTRVRIVCGKFWGKTGPVDGIAADPIYLDVSVPPGQKKDTAGRDDPPRLRLRFRGFGKVLQCVGSACGSHRKRQMGGHHASREADNRSLILFDSGDEVDGAGGRGGHSVPPGLGKAPGGARGLVRPDRDEYAGAAPTGIHRTGQGTFLRTEKRS